MVLAAIPPNGYSALVSPPGTNKPEFLDWEVFLPRHGGFTDIGAINDLVVPGAADG